jgi:hypothetical protein
LGRSYTFVDAMKTFGNRLKAADLTPAYARAGTTFAGALSQYFVVLRDTDQPSSTRDGTYRAPRGGAPSARGRAPVSSTSDRRAGKRPGEPLFGTPHKKTEKKEKDKTVKIDEEDAKEEEESDAMD